MDVDREELRKLVRANGSAQQVAQSVLDGVSRVPARPFRVVDAVQIGLLVDVMRRTRLDEQCLDRRRAVRRRVLVHVIDLPASA